MGDTVHWQGEDECNPKQFVLEMSIRSLDIWVRI